MRDTEHQIQSGCVLWFRHAFPKYKDLLFAIPNGGKRHIGVAVKMKREGVVPGVPDLMVAVPSRGYHGLFIEMKSPGGRTSEAQKEMIYKLEEQNYMVEVCDSVDRFMKSVNKYFEDEY